MHVYFDMCSVHKSLKLPSVFTAPDASPTMPMCNVDAHYFVFLPRSSDSVAIGIGGGARSRRASRSLATGLTEEASSVGQVSEHCVKSDPHN